ncbi:MAG: alpha-amylase family protein, partial [Pirellulaceae bacterium]
MRTTHFNPGLTSFGMLLVGWLVAWPTLIAAEDLRQSADKVELCSGELRLPVSLDCPVFSFNTAVVGGTQVPGQMSGNLSLGEELLVQYAPLSLNESAILEVKLHLAWSIEERVLRKWAEYRLSPAREGRVLADCVLHEIQFEQLAPVAGQAVRFLSAPPQSQPGFLRGFFAGVEFPVASTRLEEGQLVLAHRPGRLLRGDTGWLTSRTVLYGIAPVGRERETFAALIDSHRPTPKSLHFNYNSWWSMSFPCSEQDVLSLMKPFADNLYRPYGASFDMFAIDMGWSDPKTFWGIRQSMFPRGLAPIKAQAENMGCQLGLWISPSSCYPPALDNEWAKSQGYETYLTGLDGKFRACCIAGPKYGEAFKDRLVALASESGVRHFKLDGYWLACPESDHGHQPGVDSHEAIAEGGIRAFQAVRAAVPDIYLELINLGYNPSPWWLYYVNVVHGAYGDDSPPGCVPCPIQRESMTTGRDFFNLQGAALIPLPDTAQEVFGIIHQTDDPFMNDAVDVILRGHAFMPLYMNPKLMNPRRWGMLASLIQWARAHETTLAQTEPLLPEDWQNGALPQLTNKGLMPRQPYGYLHWVNDRGLLLLRNPWIKQQTVHLELGRQVGVPAGVEGLAAVSLYPEVRLYGQGLGAQSVLDVTLAPYETLLLSLRAEQDLTELKPASQIVGQELKTENIKTQVTRLRFEPAATPVRGPDWTRQFDNITEGIEVSVEGEIRAHLAPAELLIILEGATHSPAVAYSRLEVNGREMPLSESHSESQWVATGLPAPEYWTILKSPLATGENTIRLQLLSDSETTTASCWAWSYENTTEEPVRYPDSLPTPEQLYLDSTPLLDSQAIPQTLLVEQQARPVVRINGIYLDT